MKALLVAALLAVLFAGCVNTTPDAAPPVGPDSIALVEKDVPGFGRCTFALAGAGGGSYGGTSIVLVGCKGAAE